MPGSSANSAAMRLYDTHWALCRNSTLVPPFNARLAYDAVKRINSQNIPGDIVELGVFRGGCSCLMAKAQMATGSARRMWLFDTFNGMPEPSSEHDDRRSKRLWKAVTDGTKTSVPGTARDRKWAYAPLEEVQSTMARTGFPQQLLRFVKGKVEETLNDTSIELPQAIALLRLDTDWYESTKVELDLLWPRLSPGGWLYVDDYGAFQGSRRAVDQWLRAKRWNDEARKAKAFKQFKYYPRTGTEDQLGSFHVWRSLYNDPLRPFNTTEESIAWK